MSSVCYRFCLCQLYFLLLAIISGCSSTLGPGPDRVFTVDEQVLALRSAPNSANLATVAGRNDFITRRQFAIDLEYTQYFAKLTKERQLGNLAGDFALLGTTFAGTIGHAAATKTILSALSTGITGAKTDIDQDVYITQTIQILQSQMEAGRSSVRTRIIANMKLDLASYTMWQGLSDLEDYYRAGTVAGALEALHASAGANSQQAKDLKNGITPDGDGVKQTPPKAAASRTDLGGPVSIRQK
jgi:hypothetical protein